MAALDAELVFHRVLPPRISGGFSLVLILNHPPKHTSARPFLCHLTVSLVPLLFSLGCPSQGSTSTRLPAHRVSRPIHSLFRRFRCAADGRCFKLNCKKAPASFSGLFFVRSFCCLAGKSRRFPDGPASFRTKRISKELDGSYPENLVRRVAASDAWYVDLGRVWKNTLVKKAWKNSCVFAY